MEVFTREFKEWERRAKEIMNRYEISQGFFLFGSLNYLGSKYVSYKMDVNLLNYILFKHGLNMHYLKDMVHIDDIYSDTYQVIAVISHVDEEESIDLQVIGEAFRDAKLELNDDSLLMAMSTDRY